jgi:hypothetical protein
MNKKRKSFNLPIPKYINKFLQMYVPKTYVNKFFPLTCFLIATLSFSLQNFLDANYSTTITNKNVQGSSFTFIFIICQIFSFILK